MALIHLSDTYYSIQNPEKNIYLKLELISLQSAATIATNESTVLLQESGAFQKGKLGSGQGFKQNAEIVEVKADIYKYYINPETSKLKYSIIESSSDDLAADQPGTLIKEIDPTSADIHDNIVSYNFDIFFS